MKATKYRIGILGMVILSGLLLLGCTKTINGLSTGTYTAQGAEGKIIPASITFDVEKRTFTFSYDVLSSYLPAGSWDFDGKKVVARTDDGKFVYRFEVVDNDTIRFVQKGSSQITATDGTAPVIDGTAFVFTE